MPTLTGLWTTAGSWVLARRLGTWGTRGRGMLPQVQQVTGATHCGAEAAVLLVLTGVVGLGAMVMVWIASPGAGTLAGAGPGASWP